MPQTTWGPDRPTLERHSDGYTIPLTLTHHDGDDETGPHWTGLLLFTPGLTAADITYAIAADPDATDDHLPEALALAREQTAAGVQAQVDALTDAIFLGGF